MPAILIIDDHVVVRQGIKQILTDELRGVVCGEAGSATEALAEIRKRSWDAIILDLSIPDKGGLEILQEIKSRRPKSRVLILSMYGEDEYAVKALQAGAVGYIAKNRPRLELLKAIRTVLSGGQYISPLAAAALAVSTHAEEPLHSDLSIREHEILCCIASGKKVLEIAAELSLSAKTVSTYRRRVLQKMGMRTNAQLTRYAIDRGLI